MLTPVFDHEIPEMTAEIARSAFPKGNVVMKIRDVLGPIFEDKQFADIYPTIGQPAASPTCLALVTILQFMEDLTDREAADAVRGRIDWKYLLGLELNDPGIHYSVLSEFRLRLLENEAEQMLLTKILEGCQAAGLLNGKKKQRTDSTYVLANIRVLNRLELVGETMRRVLDDIAQVAPDWLKPLIEPEWGKRYGRKVDMRQIRKSESKKQELAQAIGEDGQVILTAIYQGGAPVEVKQLASVEVLRQVWIQQYYQVDDEIQWRTKEQQGLPPSRKMIASPDELEARYGAKERMTWTGYKIHLTETCDEASPRLITHVETTVATTPDGSVTTKIQNDLIEQGLSPTSHWVDGGYADVDVLLKSQEKGIDLIGPMHQDTSWQTKVEGGYDQSKFSIDWDKMIATCPEGETSVYWKKGKTASGKANIDFTFSQSACQACAARERCTRAKKTGRQLSVLHQEAYEALQCGRQRQETEDFKELYHLRAGIEGTIGQAVNDKGARRSRYRGLARTHLQHIATAAAINLERVARWLMGERPEATRISPFAVLASPI